MRTCFFPQEGHDGAGVQSWGQLLHYPQDSDEMRVAKAIIHLLQLAGAWRT